MSFGKKGKARSEIVRDSVNTFGTNLFGSVLGLLSTVLVLRNVAAETKGFYNQVQVWGGGFNTVLGLSVTAAVIYYVARYKIKNAKAAIGKAAALLSVAIVLISAAVLFLMRGSHTFQKTPTSFLAAIVVYGLASFVFGISTSILRGENKFKFYNIVNLTQRVLVTVLNAYIAFRPSASLWIWGTVFISIAMVAFAFYGITRWNGPQPEPAPGDDVPVPLGSVMGYSLKSHVSNILTYLNTNLGSYLVQGKYEMADFGVYNTAVTMMQQVWLLPDAVSQVIMSRLAAMQVQSDKLRLTLLSSKLVTYVTTAGTLLMLWVARLLVPVLFPRYVGALDPLAYLIVGSIFISYAKVLTNSIAAYGRPELNILPNALAAVINVAGSMLLIPLMGINGIAAATSASLTVQGLSSIAIFCAYSHTPFYRLLVPSREEIATVKRVFKR